MSLAPLSPAEPDREQIAGLAKGLAVIEAFGARADCLTLSEVARLTGLSPASARRCLRTLETLGYATFDGRYYGMAPRTLRLGHAYLASSALPKLAQQAVEHLTELTSEASSVAVLDGAHVVFIANAVGRRSLSEGLVAGARLPAYCSASGRVLLAQRPPEEAGAVLAGTQFERLTPRTLDTPEAVADEIAQVHRQGFAVVDGELEIGALSIAVPVRTAAGAPCAAISLALRGPHTPVAEVVQRLLPLLQNASRRLSAGLSPSLP